MYSIKIIDGTNGELALDMLSPSFPYNFESNSIAELNDSSASWSYTITLPRSKNNERIFGFAGSPFVNSNTPYKRMLCNVYSDGVLIIDRGVLYIDSVTSDAYKVQILSGNANVFDLLTDLSFAQNAASWSPVVTLPNISGSLSSDLMYPNNAGDYFFPNIRVDDVSYKTNLELDGTVYWFATPLLRIGAPGTGGILKLMLQRIGYTLETDTPDDVLQNMWLSLTKRKRWNQSNSYIWASELSNTGLGNLINNDCKTQYGHSRIVIRATVNSYFDTHHNQISLRSVIGNFESAGGEIFGNVFNENGELVAQTRSGWVIGTGNNITYTFDLENTSARYYYVTFGATATDWKYYDGSAFSSFTGLSFTNSRWQLYTMPNDENDNAFPGSRINLAENTGLSNAMELFKVLSQTFGWTIKVDPNNKIIYARTFDYIKNRKQYAPDWTNRVVESSSETTFDIGSYARENIVSFQENKMTGYKDESSFTIPNENLDTSKTMLNVKVCSGTGTRVEQWKYDADDKTYKWSDGNAPHLLSTVGVSTSSANNVTASDVVTNYSSLISTLQHVVKHKLKMALSVLDIINFDPFTPIYLQQFGAYYYVNKISNWEIGKTCDVELMQI